MSRQNKVNPGRYTQRGRLTQDDAARELRKQSAIRSPHTWQPVHTTMRTRPAPAGDAVRDTERPADEEAMAEISPQVETRPDARVTRSTRVNAPASNARAKAPKAKTARTRKSKRPTSQAMTGKTKTGKAKTGKGKTDKAMTTAMKRTTTKPKRKAVLARNVGGGGAAPRSTTKRRKSRAIRRRQ